MVSYSHRVPSLFRRKPTNAGPDAGAGAAEAGTSTAGPSRTTSKQRTPSKRELGLATPKRQNAQARRVEPPPANRRQAYQRMRAKQRVERAEQQAGVMSGDAKFLTPRDRGPERALVRDVVDSRRTVGTYFFGGALLVLVGSSQVMPPVLRLASNVLWAALAIGVILDSLIFCRKIRRLLDERYPKTDQRPMSLYLYAVTRGLTFRRMRVPKPRVQIGDKV